MALPITLYILVVHVVLCTYGAMTELACINSRLRPQNTLPCLICYKVQPALHWQLNERE